MTIEKKIIPVSLCLLLVMIAIFPEVASAQTGGKTLGDIADYIVNQEFLKNIAAYVLSPICYIAGVAFGIKAALSFKDLTEGDRQTKLKTPIIFFCAAGIALALPTLMGVGLETLGFAGQGSDTSESQVEGFGY